MRRILTIILLIPLALAAARAMAAEQVDLELVLAIDVSGSVDGFEARLQRDGYVAAFSDPVVLRAIRSGPHKRIAVTYFEWAGFGHTIPTIPWTVIGSEEDAIAFTQALRDRPIVRGRYTSISGAIGFGIALFGQSDRDATRRVIDVSGDGPNNIGPIVTSARDRAARQQITINGLPIINDRLQPYGLPQIPNLDLYFENCVIGGPGAFIVVADSFQDFGSAIRRKLILEIAGITPRDGAHGTAQARSAGKFRFPGLAAPYVPAVHQTPGAPRFEVPDCRIGERMLEQFRFRRFDDFQ